MPTLSPLSPPSADRTAVPRLAVLIDADNTSPDWTEAIFEEVATLGEASVRRIYGDFSGTQLRGWNKKLENFAVLPHQQFAYTKGKNSSDIALVIDAMDLLHSGRFDGFVPRTRPGRVRHWPRENAGSVSESLQTLHLR